jgi:hypothetical protein
VLLAVPADSPARFRRRGHILTAVEYCLAVYRHLPPAPLWYLYFSGAAVGSILSTGISGAYLLIKAQHCFECASLAVMALQQVGGAGWDCLIQFSGGTAEESPCTSGCAASPEAPVCSWLACRHAALRRAPAQPLQVAVRGFGSTPSADEIQEAGNSCPICQVRGSWCCYTAGRGPGAALQMQPAGTNKHGPTCALPACPLLPAWLQDSYRSPVKLSCNHIFCSDCCGEWFERERTCPMCRAAVGPANKRFKSFADGRTPLFPLLF